MEKNYYEDGVELRLVQTNKVFGRTGHLRELGEWLKKAVPGAHKIVIKDWVSPPECIVEIVFYFRFADYTVVPLTVLLPEESIRNAEQGAQYAKYIIQRHIERLAGEPEWMIDRP